MIMFLYNKYYKWYTSIIENARDRVISGGTSYEKHHIIPKSLGGTNESSNLVMLTTREHFVCHYLLTKCTEGVFRRKMCYALSSFHRSNRFQKRVLNSREYALLREISKETCRHALATRKLKRGVESPRYGIKHTQKTKQTLRQKKISSAKFCGRWYTPWGEFECVSDATSFVKNNNILGVVDNDTLRRYCTTDNNKIIGGRRSNKEWLGKTPKQLGFNFVGAKQ